MTLDAFPEPTPTKPIWLVTLADLALLLVGFFVFLQAAQHLDRRSLAAGIRQGFGGAAAVSPEPLPVAAAGVFDFAPGSAALPASTPGLIAWARAATADPRVSLTVTGATAGGSDVDPTTGSAAILAADRARAVAAALAAAGVPTSRTSIQTGGQGRRVVVTLAFTGASS